MTGIDIENTTTETEVVQEEAKPTKKLKRVSITVPRGDEKGDPNLFIAINGVNYLLPRGKTSQVPPEVAEEFARSERAKDTFYTNSDQMIENAAAPGVPT